MKNVRSQNAPAYNPKSMLDIGKPSLKGTSYKSVVKNAFRGKGFGGRIDLGKKK